MNAGRAASRAAAADSVVSSSAAYAVAATAPSARSELNFIVAGQWQCRREGGGR